MQSPLPLVRLREVRDEDLPVLYEQQADPLAWRMAAVPARSREDFLAHWAKLRSDGSVRPRAVEADGELAGFIGAWNRDGERQTGYFLGRAFWGRGIASEALRQFLLLEEHRPLWAHVAKSNLGSVRVLEKNGFVLESSSLLVVDDRFHPAKEGFTFVDLRYRLD